MKRFFFLILLMQIVGCDYSNANELKTISPQELSRLNKAGDIFLVDVHIPEQRHIKGTDLFIPFNNIAGNIGKFPKDKNTPIYLYCKGGPMGNAAAKALFKNGYTNIYNLVGGADAWKRAGYKVE